MLTPANVLLLDEPTNHLDENGRAVFEDALGQYKGAFVIVSHDRYLVDRLARKVLLVKDGSIKEYLGNYTDYLWKSSREGVEKEDRPETLPKRSQRQERKEEKRREARIRQKSYEKKKAIRKLELEIESLEEKVTDIEKTLSRPDIHKDGDRVRDLVYQDRDLRERLGELYEKLEAALSRLEE